MRRRALQGLRRAARWARIGVLGAVGQVACSDDTRPGAPLGDVGADQGVSGAPDAGPDAQPVPACSTLGDLCTVGGEVGCGRLFGRPSERTGLPAEACAPECACGDGRWSPPPIEAEVLDALRGFVPANPPAPLAQDPYQAPEADEAQPFKVCALRFDAADPSLYTLQTFDGPEAAQAARAQITHFGACGLCSSLQDLAVYIAIPDLTQPVRQCGVTGLTRGAEAQRACIAELGFTEACAQIWSFNTTHTGAVCRDVCLPLLTAPYHTEDGSPNACIQCDEDRSGPVFKAVAGRTRRNSGLPTALCRPCSEVQLVDHRYRTR